MKPLQQDDIQDWLNETQREFRFIHLPSKNIVRAINKSQAIIKFKNCHNISAKRIEVRQTKHNE